MSTRQQPSVLIVDDQRDAARTLRRALEQSGRDYIVSDVPSGEEAQLELLRRPFDLLIVAEQLPGVPGPELLARVQRTRPEMAGIILANRSLDEVRAATAGLNILWYFERPARTPDVVSVVHEALYGDAPEPQEPPLTDEAASSPPTQAPSLEVAAGMLAALRADLGAFGAALIHTSGEMWISDGAAATPEFERLAALLAENFARGEEITRYLGGGTSFYHISSARLELYAFSCGPEALIAVLLPGGSTRQMGRALHYGQAAASHIAEQLYGKQQPERTTAPPPARETASAPAVREAPAVPPTVEEPAPPRRTGSTDRLMNLSEPGSAPGEIDLDLDGLEDVLGEDVEDLDAYWEEAAALHTRVSDDALSLDEAIELGLFPDDEDDFDE